MIVPVRRSLCSAAAPRAATVIGLGSVRTQAVSNATCFSCGADSSPAPGPRPNSPVTPGRLMLREEERDREVPRRPGGLPYNGAPR